MFSKIEDFLTNISGPNVKVIKDKYIYGKKMKG